MEIVQASFRKKYDYGYFYFRNPTHLEEKLQDIDPSQKESVSTVYKPESEYAARKLRELKQQTIDTGLWCQYFTKLLLTGTAKYQLVLHFLLCDWLGLVPVIKKNGNNRGDIGKG